jgi:hypothetical protein
VNRGPVADKTFSPDLPKVRGVAFARMGKQVRSVFRQLDDSIILADACKCFVEYLGGGMSVRRSSDCPIDEHRIAAIQGGGDF